MAISVFGGSNAQVQGTLEENLAANDARRRGIQQANFGPRTPLGYNQGEAQGPSGPVAMPQAPLAGGNVTEPLSSLADYQAQVNSTVPVSREQSDAIRAEGGFKNFGAPNTVFDGVDEDGQPLQRGVTNKDYTKAAQHYERPSNVGILDVESLISDSVYDDTYAKIDSDNATDADAALYNMSSHLGRRLDSDSEAYNEELANIVGKLQLRDMGQLSSVLTHSLAGSLWTQDSFIAGHVTGATSLSMDDIQSYGVEHEGIQTPSQIGMDQDNMTRSIADRLKLLLRVADVDTSAMLERDYQVIGAELIQHSMNSGQLVRIKENGSVTLAPNGAHVGTILGMQSDALVGADIQREVSAIPTTEGVHASLGPIPSNLDGTNSPSGKQPIQPTIVMTKDVVGHMAFGVDSDILSAAFLQISDVLIKLVNPNASTDANSNGTLIHSESKFADMLKLDLGTADAAYRNKLYKARSDKPEGVDLNPMEIAKIQQDVNKITNTRVDEVITNLNKQLKLIKEGQYAEASRAFYYTFGNGDINGRIYNTTHNGNYTLDKVTGRQVHKAKINPRLNITEEGSAKRNKRVNNAAKSFNKIIDAIPSDIEAEIAFRVVMVSTILKDAKHARKALGRGEETTVGNAAIALAQSSGLVGLNNLSNRAMYEAYGIMNRNDPLRVMRHLAVQGREIQATLKDMNKTIMELEVIPFDPRSNAKERKELALASWGDITTANIKPLEDYASERGELRQQMSIRKNAFQYIEALENPKAPKHFELDFEVELDAKQSGPFLQSLIAPGTRAGSTLDKLGYKSNTAEGDLRDTGKAILLGGLPTAAAFGNKPEMAAAWDKLIAKAFSGDKAGVARELFLKQTIMQYYYGKPKSMFGDIAEEILGYFNDEVMQDSLLESMPGPDRVKALASVIENMLDSPHFDVEYIEVMKGLGQSLALTGSDLVIQGPMGPINLTIESLAQAFTDADETGAVKTPQALRLDLIELIDNDGDAFNVSISRRTTDTYAAKGNTYNQDRPLSGRNYPSKPGKRLADSLGVLIIHQLDNAVMNHTINTVNMNRNRNNPLPAKIIYDAVITNAAGMLRYSHTYNNESIPILQTWNLGEAIQKTMDKAAKDFEKRNRGKETFNLSVVEGTDGNLHAVEQYAVLTSWMDDYYIHMPKKEDYPGNIGGYKVALGEYTSKSMTNADERAKAAGYLPPVFNPDYLKNGMLPRGEPMIMNAAERANMHISREHFGHLFNIFQQRYTGRLNKFKASIARNKAELRKKPRKEINHLGQ